MEVRIHLICMQKSDRLCLFASPARGSPVLERPKHSLELHAMAPKAKTSPGFVFYGGLYQLPSAANMQSHCWVRLGLMAVLSETYSVSDNVSDKAHKVLQRHVYEYVAAIKMILSELNNTGL